MPKVCIFFNSYFQITFPKVGDNSHSQSSAHFPASSPALLMMSLHLRDPKPTPRCWFQLTFPTHEVEPLPLQLVAIWISLNCIPLPIFYWLIFLSPICRSSFYSKNEKPLFTLGKHCPQSIIYHMTSSEVSCLMKLNVFFLSFTVSQFLVSTMVFLSLQSLTSNFF